MKSRPLYAIACVLLLSVAGCSQVPASDQSGQSGSGASGPALPALDPAADVRDQIARSESAIAAAGADMAALATDCADCRAALDQVRADADARLTLSGGMWNPWPTADAAALATLPEPAATGEAPHTPAGLVGYMVQTTNNQMAALVAAPDMAPEDSAVLASILAGRLVSARSIASSYGVVPSDAAAALQAQAAQTTVGVPVVAAQPLAIPADARQSGDQSGAQSGAGDSPWPADAAAAQALVAYDCVGTTLGFTELTATALEAEETINRDLLGRVTELTERGVPDGRGVRCVLQDHTTDSVLNSLIASDLTFMGSPSPQIRAVAAGYLMTDLDRLISLGSADNVSPGLTAPSTTGTGTTATDTTQSGEGA